MRIKEIDSKTFDVFAKNHILKNYYQTSEYGTLMENSNYEVMYIAGIEANEIVAASLILHKEIGKGMRYGYAPRGFLIDYYDTDLLEKFTTELKEYFIRKSFAFIKINPEITYAIVDINNQSKTVSSKNKQLIQTLKELGYDKLKDNLYFEAMLPKFTPIINLKQFNMNCLDSTMKNEIENDELYGLKLVNGTENDLNKFYSYVENKNFKTKEYYEHLYKEFKQSDMIDLLLVKVDYQLYIKYLQKQYAYENEINEKLNNDFNLSPNNQQLYEKKTISDQNLSRISSEITLANKKLSEDNMSETLGAALIIKQQGRINIEISGNSNDFNELDVKTFMYYKIIQEYKKAGYLFIDMNGITGDFTDTNPYKKLNDFKLKFRPTVYEYLGEFDLIINKPFHQLLYTTNKIQNEFYRPAIKK